VLIGPDTTFLTLQNGLGNVVAAAPFVPQDRLLYGITILPGDMKGSGHVASHGAGIVRLSAADRGCVLRIGNEHIGDELFFC